MRTRIAETGGRTVDYTYDNLYRLTSETIAGDGYGVNGRTDYTMDVVGNRTERTSSIVAAPSAPDPLEALQTFAYTDNDWLASHTYDDNGNTVLSGEPSSQDVDTYDFQNRLIGRAKPNGDVIEITYNAMGDRVAKRVNALTTHFLVDRNNLTGYAQVVEELNSLTGSLTVRRVYLYGLDLISQDQLLPNPTGGEDWQTTFYHYDGLGTVRALSGTDGLTTDAYWYDAYGVLLNVVGTTPNAYLYTGEQWDADLGMYFLRARYMEPGSGRFWTMDSYEGRGADPATLHKYLYVHGNPVMEIDPSGNLVMGLLTGVALYGRIQRSYTVSRIAILGRVAARLILASAVTTTTAAAAGAGFGLFQLAQLDPSFRAKRKDLALRTRERIAQKSRNKGCKTGVLYHYTDRVSAIGIGISGKIFASPRFRTPASSLGRGMVMPVGAYATDIPPFSLTMTQAELSFGFFNNRMEDVSHFVAICNDGFWRVGAPYDSRVSHFVKSTRSPGVGVDVDVITVSLNLML